MTLLTERCALLPLGGLTWAIDAGARDDAPGFEGLTQLAARALRRTAGHRSTLETERHLDAIGATADAHVSPEATSFQVAGLSRAWEAMGSYAEGLQRCPGLGTDDLRGLLLEAEGELAELLDNDGALARRWFHSALYGSAPAARSTRGTQASLARLTPELLRRRAAELQQATVLQTALWGDLPPSEPRDWLQARGLAPAGGTLPRCEASPIIEPGRHLVLVDKPERTQTQILIGAMGADPLDDDLDALLVATTALGGNFGSRLMQEVRAQRGWSYGAYAQLRLGPGRRDLSLWTFPKWEDAAACIALQWKLLEDWVSDGLEDDELEATRNYLCRSHVFHVDTAQKRLQLRWEAKLLGLPEDHGLRLPERIARVTQAEIHAALQRRISPQNLVVVVLGTAATLLPSLERDLGPQLASLKVVPHDQLAP